MADLIEYLSKPTLNTRGDIGDSSIVYMIQNLSFVCLF
jgi:hypothetical protein